MRGKRFTEEQIIAVVKEAEAGAKTLDLCRRHGVREPFYRWKARYGGLEVSDLPRLRQLEDENSSPQAPGASIQVGITSATPVGSRTVTASPRRRGPSTVSARPCSGWKG